MIGNVVVHLVLGLIGTQLFTFSLSGLAYCVAFVTFTQATEIYRLYGSDLKNLKELPEKKPSKGEEDEAGDGGEKARKELYSQMLKTFGENFILQSCVVFFAAEIARQGGI